MNATSAHECSSFNYCNFDLNETISDDDDDNESSIEMSQQYQRYNEGRWTKEEQELFIEGLVKYKNDWKSIHKNISTRSPIQVRSHAQKFFLMCKKEFSKGSGSKMENIQILNDIFSSTFYKLNYKANEEFYIFIQKLIFCSENQKHKTHNSNIQYKKQCVIKKEGKYNNSYGGTPNENVVYASTFGSTNIDEVTPMKQRTNEPLIFLIKKTNRNKTTTEEEKDVKSTIINNNISYMNIYNNVQVNININNNNIHSAERNPFNITFDINGGEIHSINNNNNNNLLETFTQQFYTNKQENVYEEEDDDIDIFGSIYKCEDDND